MPVSCLQMAFFIKFLMTNSHKWVKKSYLVLSQFMYIRLEFPVQFSLPLTNTAFRSGPFRF